MAKIEKIRRNRRARWLGFALGATLAVVGLAAAARRVSPQTGTLGADVTFTSASTRQLDVRPGGAFFQGFDMKPGTPPQAGSVSVTNRTGSRVAVRFRALPSDEELDDLLRVSIEAGRKKVFEGSLADLRRWTVTPILLGSRGSVRVGVTVRLSPSPLLRHVGRTDDVNIEFISAERGV